MRILAAAAAVLISTAAAQAQTPSPANPMAFMAQNALDEGVRTLPSGVQIKVLKSGPDTGARPKPEDTVTVNYEGKLLSGQVFDSSYKSGKPVSFRVDALIPGWTEVLQLMRPGDEWMLWIPPSRGYGAERKGPIPGNSVLVFRLELLKIGA